MIFVSIISHRHDELLIRGSLLRELAGCDRVLVVLKDNVPSQSVKQLCATMGVTYLDQVPHRGFGDNNNIVFRYIQEEIGFSPGDFFIAVNPDIRISVATLTTFIMNLKEDRHRLGTLNLFKDDSMTQHDWSIRKFPSLIDIFSSRFLGRVRNLYDKRTISQPQPVDWGSGALLAFEWTLFRDLGGFDERYFMYFEDVDICWRAKRDFGVSLYFYPQYKAVHLAQHANRKLLSRHAWWFLKGFVRFTRKRFLRAGP